MFALVGQTTETGKQKIVQTLPPRNVKFREILRDCGQCAGCRYRRRMDWAIRLEHEASFHRDAIFLTLTYDDDHLPHAGSLVIDHTSKFVRALRDHLRRKKIPASIRYFAVGEYGGEFGRPHYHLILFGWFPADASLAYTKHTFSQYSPEFQAMFGRQGIRHYSSATIDRVWKRGLAHFSTVSSATMQYVTKYHVDKITGDAADDHYIACVGDDVVSIESESARMSRMPAIGTRWIEKYWREVYPAGVLVSKSGSTFAAPKFYDRWLEKNQPEVYEQLKAKRDQRICFDKYIDARLTAIDVNRSSQMLLGTTLGKGPYHGSSFGVTAADLARSAFR